MRFYIYDSGDDFYKYTFSIKQFSCILHIHTFPLLLCFSFYFSVPYKLLVLYMFI